MTNNTKKTLEFLSYINTPLSKGSINVLYNANKVNFERTQLYSDFIQSLITLVMDTYMGDEFTSPKQRVQHFNWCWFKNIDNFKEEGIQFRESKELYEYIKHDIVESYYMATDKGDENTYKDYLTKVWKYIFSYSSNKTRSDVEIFIKLYRLFEKSLNF